MRSGSTNRAPDKGVEVKRISPYLNLWYGYRKAATPISYIVELMG